MAQIKIMTHEFTAARLMIELQGFDRGRALEIKRQWIWVAVGGLCTTAAFVAHALLQHLHP